MSHGNSSAKDRPSVGRTLQQARIKAELTVEAVSSATRVRVPIIQAIEEDDFSRCGGEVYARGHIRTLARAVGIDPSELVEMYHAQQGTSPEPVATVPLFEAERIRPEPRRPNWTAAMVAAIVAVVGFVGFTFFSGDDTSGTVAEDATGTGEPDKDKPRQTAKQTPEAEPSESAVAAAPADKVTVRVSVQGGESWISAKDGSGRLMFEGVLADGDSETFTDDDRIDLVLGNAGVVELHVNGKEIEDVGDSGQVERLSYTPGDPEEG